MTPIIAYVLGVLTGGAACAFSAKTLGWFNKQAKSIEAKV